jgi:hypothetical protein
MLDVVERVALAHAVNAEIREVAAGFEDRGGGANVAWLCACGCFDVVQTTLAEYDARAGDVYARGHPLDASRAAAAAAYHEHPETVRVDEQKRRELAARLAPQLRE